MNSKKIFILILLSTVLVLPSLASAQITIQGMVDGAVTTTLYIAGGVVVIFWVIAGILFLSAQGAPEKLKSARMALITAVVGTLLVIVATSGVSLVRSAFNI